MRATSSETLTSAATGAVDTRPNSPATGAPTITGTAQVGETLTANTSGVADADGLSNVQYEYQWLADDAEVAGATGSTYTLVADDMGKAISVSVSFTDDADNEETLTSGATEAAAARPNSLATGAPTISGTVQVGETLTANTSGIADADGLDDVSFTYQWLADDSDISGATNATYTLAAADEGKAVKVEVSFTDDADNEETLTSGATEAVAAAEPAEPPDKPRGLEATATHDQVVLTWDDPWRRQHHRLRDPAARPRERYRGRVQCARAGHGQRRDHLYRRHGGGQHHLHLPDQGDQRGRNE